MQASASLFSSLAYVTLWPMAMQFDADRCVAMTEAWSPICVASREVA
eukprot:CAMPEP_0174298374 /NCGR_PEP_ID=MMETSP0809-20121228/53540_1 /TAXON_ID=73025 ORGANISM="Eutreptiella gymnastica-like, Strain CCMP1594" /NCGR_SAMPLE_ID=MMETSP0809 /ASSEMBLY_ACC=CAM_ASM_000658 /LENGTH=46 /DNA_ID= /DNA_START= /DNA_END= /DNA_ORIENTATION=